MEWKGEDAGQYSTVDSVQRYAIIKTTKSTKPDATSLESHAGARLEPPGPDKLRSVAGGVTRRTDRVERAEPPPSSSRVRADVKRERPRRRRQGGAGFGSDSDSDSDDDKPKRNRDDDDPKHISRRKLPESQPQDLPDLPMSEVDVEEQERLQQLRALRNVKEKWEAIDERRRYCRKERWGREKQLLDAIRRMPSGSPTIYQGVIDRDARLREYLDENLYGAIDKIPDESTLTQLTDLEEIVEHVEERMLESCSEFSNPKWLQRPKPMGERVVSVLQSVEQACWLSVSTDILTYRRRFRNTEGDDEQFELTYDRPRGCIPEMCRSYMAACYPDRINGTHIREPFIDMLSRKYRIKVIDAMIGSVLDRIGLHMQIQQELEEKWHQRFEGREATHINGHLTDIYLKWSYRQIQGDPKDDWLQRFRESRVNRHLTQPYMDWVFDGVSLGQLDRFRMEWHRVKREKALREFRASMASVKIQVEQEFCPDIIQPGAVSLVLVKGNHPSTVKNVSAEVLESLGWFHEMVNGQRRYWRCKLSNKGPLGFARDILKVGMDGEVLGAYCLDGPSWAFLEYKEPQLVLRPLNAAEEIALDLPQSRIMAF
ncbi:hypothetical protein DL765_005785 [Monosporascus sp. GIB2]|nr:hypothetical protein DL765_005785 [Monosporascus sp. GIB2]